MHGYKSAFSLVALCEHKTFIEQAKSFIAFSTLRFLSVVEKQVADTFKRLLQFITTCQHRKPSCTSVYYSVQLPVFHYSWRHVLSPF